MSEPVRTAEAIPLEALFCECPQCGRSIEPDYKAYLCGQCRMENEVGDAIDREKE